MDTPEAAQNILCTPLSNGVSELVFLLRISGCFRARDADPFCR